MTQTRYQNRYKKTYSTHITDCSDIAFFSQKIWFNSSVEFNKAQADFKYLKLSVRYLFEKGIKPYIELKKACSSSFFSIFVLLTSFPATFLLFYQPLHLQFAVLYCIECNLTVAAAICKYLPQILTPNKVPLHDGGSESAQLVSQLDDPASQLHTTVVYFSDD